MCHSGIATGFFQFMSAVALLKQDSKKIAGRRAPIFGSKKMAPLVVLPKRIETELVQFNIQRRRKSERLLQTFCQIRNPPIIKRIGIVREPQRVVWPFVRDIGNGFYRSISCHEYLPEIA
jgi:hypothetical protein